MYDDSDEVAVLRSRMIRELAPRRQSAVVLSLTSPADRQSLSCKKCNAERPSTTE